jgi:hypothetical protein
MLQQRSERTTAYFSEKCLLFGLQRVTAAFAYLRPVRYQKVGRLAHRPILASYEALLLSGNQKRSRNPCGGAANG